jgi:pimeloyl-ACP methyl ester carboxylesterase
LKKIWRYLLIGFLVILLTGVGGFLLWATNPAQPEPQVVASLAAYDGVSFEQVNNWLVFAPKDSQPTVGLILYPGGRVDYRAYAPHARAIAWEGFTVIIVPMPLNLAFMGINRAEDVITAFPEITSWAIGGHSLGGAMAAEFAGANPSRVDGLVLWASYPGENNDLSSANLPVLSIFAQNDGLATLEDIADSEARLPAHTIFVEITGGNHAGFGWYGDQNGDGTATISRSAQQALIVQATSAFLGTLDQ